MSEHFKLVYKLYESDKREECKKFNESESEFLKHTENLREIFIQNIVQEKYRDSIEWGNSFTYNNKRYFTALLLSMYPSSTFSICREYDGDLYSYWLEFCINENDFDENEIKEAFNKYNEKLTKLQKMSQEIEQKEKEVEILKIKRSRIDKRP
jgi:hypothetical protein